MKDAELKAFHRRMVLGEIRPADDEAARTLNRFMQRYSAYEGLQKRGDDIKAAVNLYDARRLAKDVKRLIESNRIVEGAQ